MINTQSKKKDIFYLMNKYSNVVSKTETEILLEHLFNCTRLDLYARNFVVDEYVEEQYDSLIGRRLNGEPVQYISGCAEFMGFDFIVAPDTFIPRPETELLVELTCDALHACPASRRGMTRTNGPKILDLCTGSGNIAITLTRLIPDVQIIATDISGRALKVAKKNAILHNVSNRIRFYKGNLFDVLVFDKGPEFDIIVCNPPYIKEVELKRLQKEVRKEPELSLDGGKDGLDFYRAIAENAPGYLKRGGVLLLEIGFGQARAVKDIFSLKNIYELYKVINDFNDIERVMWFNLT